MSSSERYKLWITISIAHEYYAGTYCPVNLEPLSETQLILKKHNMLFIRQKSTQWDLFIENMFDPGDLLLNEYKLIFGLYPQSEKFYYLSQESATENDAFSLEEAPMSKAWRNVELDLQHIINNKLQKIDIHITSPEKYYEYICIQKYHNSNTELKLTDERNLVEFNKEEFQPIADIQNAIRFVSTEKIKLIETNNNKIQLWEIRDSGERLISNFIPIPRVDEKSLISPQDTITTYFYF
ncbi:MAG: hypothetical protein LBP67_03840 [Bacteroidales bacterium]|jgi:hypothetical protein|nr:hypothetical protein [Bacteroidales bacterium]